MDTKVITITSDEELDQALSEIYGSYGAEYEENWDRAKPDTCQHEEWHWEEGMRVCSICYKPLCGGPDWGQVIELERRHEEEQEAMADFYAGEE